MDQEAVDAFIRNPSESLSDEVKTWLDIDKPEGQLKLVRAALALRNQNGGRLLIGFDNKTMTPDQNGRPADVRSYYSIDRVQGLVSKYASEQFEVTVEFGNREGALFPIIVVPGGVRSPVAAKKDFVIDTTRVIAADDVYVRTLNTNNTPSTAKATYKDWPDLMQRCFDNREADIGSFFRRHLSSLRPEVFQGFINGISKAPPSDEEATRAFMADGERYFEAAKKKRDLVFPDHGTWEVALIIHGDSPKHNLHEVLDLMRTHNPRYTGWPVWMDPRHLDRVAGPYTNEGHWEALVDSRPYHESLDYLRIDPKGKFFLVRALEDDLLSGERAPMPMTAIDVVVPIWRTAEAIAVGLAFAKGWGFSAPDTKLSFMFKWTRLSGRRLISWRSYRWSASEGTAHQDTVSSYVEIPMDTPLSAVAGYVSHALSPLYEAFAAATLDDASLVREVEKVLKIVR